MNFKQSFLKFSIYCFVIFIASLFLFFIEIPHIVGKIIIIVIINCLIINFLLLHTKDGNEVLCFFRGFILSFRCQSKNRRIKVGKNVRIFNPKNISFGKNVEILQEAVFAPFAINNKEYPSRIIVGNNVHFGVQDRIASANKVVIEDDVLFAAFVHITDHSHEFHNVGIPVINQGIYSKGPVVIKRGAWLAFGSHVLSGVTVGEYSVVGANAVVTKDVPPYSVVVGNPARIVSQYDFKQKKWVHVKN